jgi:hypothetical protein
MKPGKRKQTEANDHSFQYHLVRSLKCLSEDPILVWTSTLHYVGNSRRPLSGAHPYIRESGWTVANLPKATPTRCDCGCTRWSRCLRASCHFVRQEFMLPTACCHWPWEWASLSSYINGIWPLSVTIVISPLLSLMVSRAAYLSILWRHC